MEASSAVNEKIRKTLLLALNSSYQLDQEAFAFITSQAETRDIVKLMEQLIAKLNQSSSKSPIITRQLLAREIEVYQEKTEEGPPSVSIETGKGLFQPYAKNVESEVQVLEDPTEEISSMGETNDFLNYFRDRFARIERILRQRLDARDSVSISEALEAPIKKEVKTIGIVTQKTERKKTILIQIEDLTSTATVLVPPGSDEKTLERAGSVLLDQVVCVLATRSRENVLIAKDFILPDIPERKPRGSSEDVCAALISDLHVGSKAFLNDVFCRFLSWLKGDVGNGNQREIAGKVKYVIIAGDLVDGIGVYPNQESELAVKDIYEQYRLVAGLIGQIPDYIEVIAIPGNHDATRQALPQPAIPRKYVEPVLESREIIMLGNPARVRLHGVEVLLYHGKSLDDIIGSVPEITYQNLNKTITKAMKHLLRGRHLAPVYGGRTSIAPEPRDRLIVERVPDIFHVGHVHVIGSENYRGTLILNSGAWQTQTEFQRKMDVSPTPGIAPIVNLKTYELSLKNFML